SGTELTIELARRMGRPIRIVDLTDDPEAGSVVRWITSNRFRQVIVAGPRESECPGIYGLASAFLLRVFTVLASRLPFKAIW
ncbi:MAG: putative molybdenum carrier protein, partial [Rhodothermales bacterium]|nr:putative molybdenum carrier protein [Rhodothermales bacterium]